MPFPYDATLKSMFDISPEDWVRFLGFQSKKIAMLDSDLSTVSTSCDKAIRLEDQKLILHLEFQTGPDSDLPDRCDR